MEGNVTQDEELNQGNQKHVTVAQYTFFPTSFCSLTMKASIVLPLLALTHAALAAPADGPQVVLGNISPDKVLSDVSKNVGHLWDSAGKVIMDGKLDFNKWMDHGKEFVEQNGLVYELVSNPSLAQHQLRVTEPELCDPSVQQYSGYLDIEEAKHLFFWFFESRYKPEDAPLILWLNGGPGCSSSTGLLFELGPCSISDEGKNTTYNPYSWNAHANIIFLDQPINVGFSYSSDGSTVNTSPVAGKDVWAFLELFLNRFPKYSKQPFHLAAESYGGTYAPNIASVIHKKNQELAFAPVPSLKAINLASVILANGLTDPYVQMGSVADWACDGPYPVYDDPNGPQCQALRSKIPTCQSLINSCYKYNSRFTCVPAGLYCNSQLFAPLMQLGLNPYDVRRPCDREKDGSLCYKQMTWIDTWMNDAKNKVALGVDPNRDFTSCNMEVNQAFFFQGDGMHNSAALLPELIEDGIRLLVYAGNADMMCNFIGNERWVSKLETQFLDEFTQAKAQPWVTTHTGKLAGSVRSAGGGGFTAGNVTFVTVFEAGHMVPYDQSEAALDLITRWILDAPLSLNSSA